MDRGNWQIGQRVSLKNSNELGFVVEVERGVVKVKWDRGRTSYYRPDMPANVSLRNHKSSKAASVGRLFHPGRCGFFGAALFRLLVRVISR
jgi:hypothetical protein